jgi:hypothetical protein
MENAGRAWKTRAVHGKRWLCMEKAGCAWKTQAVTVNAFGAL